MAKKHLIIIMIVMATALVLRTQYLGFRPMHTDEAVHAAKLGQLLQEGTYTYDANEYHGPTLNYFTLIPAKLSGAESYEELNEFILRIVPAIFGVILILLTFFLCDGLSFSSCLIAAALITVSPAFVFYSRYYIQEMLLVCFTFGLIVCGYRYTKTCKLPWVIAAGICAGLMHATKETCVIAFAAMLLAVLLTVVTSKERTEHSWLKQTNKIHLALGVLAAAFISTLFYSSFFTNPSGIADSFRAFSTYFDRASANHLHIHPWYYYFDLLTYIEGLESSMWNEDFIVVFAAIGIFYIFKNSTALPADTKLLRFIAFYTITMTAVYSAIPYKTPWCLLGFFHPMALLAGFAFASLIKALTTRNTKTVFIMLLILFGGAIPLHQVFLGNFRYAADPKNPYVYAHTSTDIYTIVKRISAFDKDTSIQVVTTGDDYWPLPWYLRGYKNVAYQSSVDRNAPIAPIIICSPDIEQPMIDKLYSVPPPGKRHMYVSLFGRYIQLRPGVELKGLIKKDLSDKHPDFTK